MNNLISKINNSFIKSFFQLAVGSLLAQIIAALASPIITRLYSPKDMGLYTLLITVVTIFGSVINGKYDYAIVNAKKEEHISKLFWVSTFFSIIFSALICLVILIVHFFRPNYFSDTGNWIYFAILLLLITGLTNTLTAYNNRIGLYKIISKVSVLRASVQNIFTVAIGLVSASAGGLIISQLMGSLAGIREQSSELDSKNIIKNLKEKNKIREIALEYKDYPKYSMPANLVNNLSYSILNIFISNLFSMTTLGFYSITYRILGLPLGLVSGNISRIFFKDASEEFREKGSYKNSLIKSTILLSCVAIPFFVILLIFSPSIFSLVLGTEWRVSGEYAQILAPMFAVRLVVSGLTPGFIISGNQKIELNFQILFLFISIISFLISKIFMWEISSFLMIYSISNTLIYFVLYLFIFKYSTINTQS